MSRQQYPIAVLLLVAYCSTVDSTVLCSFCCAPTETSFRVVYCEAVRCGLVCCAAAMLYGTAAAACLALLYWTTRYTIVPRSTLLFCTVLFLYCRALHCTGPWRPVLRCILCAVLPVLLRSCTFCAARYCPALLYCNVLPISVPPGISYFIQDCITTYSCTTL